MYKYMLKALKISTVRQNIDAVKAVLKQMTDFKIKLLGYIKILTIIYY